MTRLSMTLQTLSQTMSNTTYGLCKHHIANARETLGELSHDDAMKHLKAAYEGRKRIHDSLHDEDKGQ